MSAPVRYEKRYCETCMRFHWLEITPARRQICHGANYLPKDSPTHYTRWRYGGIELCEKITSHPLPLDWQMAFDEIESIDQSQDW